MNLEIRCLWGFIPKSIFNQLPYVIEKYNINTRNKLAHFLAQCMAESEFNRVEENLNYSSSALLKTFPNRISKKTANKIANNPEMIGNVLYKYRMGNGDYFSGDGWKYRGRGYLQLTGKENYYNFSKFIKDDVVKFPDLVAKKYPLDVSAWYFQNRVKDKGNLPLTSYGVQQVTAVVKGRIDGWKNRYKLAQKFGAIIDCKYTGKDYYGSSGSKIKTSFRKSFR